MRIHQVDRFWLKNLIAITVGVIFDNIKKPYGYKNKKDSGIKYGCNLLLRIFRTPSQMILSYF